MAIWSGNTTGVYPLTRLTFGSAPVVHARPLVWRLFVLCGAVTLPLFVFVAVILTQYAQSARDHLQRAGQDSVRDIADDLDRDIASLKAVLETLSFSTRITAKDFASFHALASVVARNADVSTVLSDRQGQQIVNTRLPYGSELPPRTNPFDEAIATRKPAISDLFTGAVSKTLVYSLAAPVFASKSGEVEYLLAFSVDPVRLRDLMLASTLDPHAIAGVVDKNGRTMARTLDHEKYLGTRPDALLAEIGDRREGQVRVVSRDGNAILASFTRMKSTGWIVAYGVPVSFVDEPMRRLMWQVFGMGFLTLMIAGAGGYFYARRIVGALASLGHSASDVGRGEIVQPLKTAVSEINDVGERLARASHDLRQTTEAKDALLYEVNHRVKNSLAVVTSLLAMQVRQTPDDALKRGLEDLRVRIDVMASVHQRLYESGRHDRLDLGQFLQEIATEMTQALGRSRTRLTTDCDRGVIVGVDRTTSLALIVGELLTNAIKHGVQDAACEIIVTTKRMQDGRIAVTVSDDGPGLPAEFSVSGRSGMGMRIVSGLVRQIRGELRVNAGEAGARFEIIVEAEA
jgi:two-component sensor histidine kinase